MAQFQFRSREEGASSSGADAAESTVQVLIRSANPGQAKDLTLALDKSTTVGGLKELIHRQHKDAPATKDQVLILAGKVLKDADVPVHDLLQNTLHAGGPHSIHLVVQAGKEADPEPVPSSVGGGANFRIGDAGRGGATGASGTSVSGIAGGTSASVSASASPAPSPSSSARLRNNGSGPSGRSASSSSSHARRVYRSRTAAAAIPEASTSGIQGQGGSNLAVVPQGAVAVPYMMVNPVVSAAYSAAFAAMSTGNAPAAQVPMPGAGMQTFPPPPTVPPQDSSSSNHQSQASTSGEPQPHPQPPAGGPAHQQQTQSQQQAVAGNAQQGGLPPLIPAIAFFPLGVPVLVPAANPPQGFQIQNQYVQQQQQGPPSLHPPPGQRMPVNANPPGLQVNIQAPLLHRQGHHHHHHGPGQPARRRRRRVIMYRISIRGVLQLVLMLAVLYAYTSRGRFLAVVVTFCVIYLAARPLRRILGQLTHPGPGRQGIGQPRGIIHEILSLVLGFITSVFPTWNVNVQDEAAFAAAQEMVNREGREQARDRPGNEVVNGGRPERENNGNAHPHQD